MKGAASSSTWLYNSMFMDAYNTVDAAQVKQRQRSHCFKLSGWERSLLRVHTHHTGLNKAEVAGWTPAAALISCRR